MPLSSKEFEVLAYLATHPGKALTPGRHLRRRLAQPVRRHHRRGRVRPEAAEEDREGPGRARLHRDGPRDGLPVQRGGDPRMKLRTQFVILVGGIIAVPFLVTRLHGARAAQRDPGPRAPSQLRPDPVLDPGHVPRAVHRHDLAGSDGEPPAGLDVVILDRDQVVISSTIAELPAGISVGGGQLWAYIAANADRFHFQVDSASRASGDDSPGDPEAAADAPRGGAVPHHHRSRWSPVHLHRPAGVLLPHELPHPALAQPLHPVPGGRHAADRGGGPRFRASRPGQRPDLLPHPLASTACAWP